MAKPPRRTRKPSVLEGPPLLFRNGGLFVAFANTVDAPPGYEPTPMRSFDDFLAWGRSQEAVSGDALDTPAETAAEIFDRALRLRTVVHRLATACARRQPVSAGDLAGVNDELRRHAITYEITTDGDAFGWSRTPPVAGEDLLWQIAASTALLFLSGEHTKIHTCKGKKCRRFVLSLYPKRPSLWCDNSICGNRDKVKRFRQRFAHFRV